MTPFVLLMALLLIAPPLFASEADNPLNLDLTQPAALQEANRVLTEEIKLAAHPQTYVLIDLVAPAILLKGRGIELHRFPIASWSSEWPEMMASNFHLVARPPVARRKIDPATAKEQEPISLADMPTRFRLAFSPPLTVDVGPTARSWAGLQWQARAWWRRLLAWTSTRLAEPELHIALSDDEAQSFAWALVDGMPLVIRRPTDK